MFQQVATFVLVAGLWIAALPAHGGQYRGGGRRVGPAPSFPSRIPSARAPAAPPVAPPGASTTAPRSAQTAATWQTWWEFNKEPFLVPRISGTVTITGSDDFYLGARRRSGSIDVLVPNAADLTDRIVPALGELLGRVRNRDVQSACLIALGKVGRDGVGVALIDELSQRIARDDQEVRESAVLALGIAGRRDAFETLSGLLQNTKAGRKLADRSAVRDRTRAFAAYGLGLLARRSGDAALAQQVHDLLWPLLEQGSRIKDRDLRVAAVSGLGVMRADTSRSADKRLAWQTVEHLLQWFDRDLGGGDELVQAHGAIAVARLLGRGSTPLHQRCKQHFAQQLNARKRRGRAILQSCAIALGMLVEPQERRADDQAFSEALQRHYEKGHDQATRFLAAIAVGRIGGAANRVWLMKAYQRGNKSTERPWLALALGLLAHPAARSDKPDALLGDLLLRDLQSAQTDDVRSALAVAVGLTGHAAAVPPMLRLLRDSEGDQRVAGYLAIGLGLLGDSAATPAITAILERSERRPFLLQQCAVALGCLGDVNANQRLVAMMKKGNSAAVLAALATAVGRIGDRRAIDPLVELLRDKDMTKLAQAFVAAALGGVGDKDEMPWNVPFSVDSNFLTAIDTLSNGATGVLDIL